MQKFNELPIQNDEKKKRYIDICTVHIILNNIVRSLHKCYRAAHVFFLKFAQKITP